MTGVQRQQAQAIAGWWTSTEDDVGFSASLGADGKGLIVFGTPLKTVRGPWWVASSPLRIVLQREDGGLEKFRVVQFDGELMVLQPSGSDAIVTLKKAWVITE